MAGTSNGSGNGNGGQYRIWGPLASLAAIFGIVQAAQLFVIDNISEDVQGHENRLRDVEVQQGRFSEVTKNLEAGQTDFLRKYLKVDQRSQDNKDAIGRIQTKMESP